jgi:hypothetical protein
MAFRADGEQNSERGDAGTSIATEVFGFVKENHLERSGGSALLRIEPPRISRRCAL